MEDLDTLLAISAGVHVQDSVIGITPEAQSNLSVPLLSTKANGREIGLTMVKEILNRYGFEFSLESRPGDPTRFTIRFNEVAAEAGANMRTPFGDSLA
ncbi:MAG: ATP-binding protein [Acidobacteriia bacterium]|nr:ATP-binding protein [Terriglobia bacterium]